MTRDAPNLGPDGCRDALPLELLREFIFWGLNQFYNKFSALLSFDEVFKLDGIGFVIKRSKEYERPGNSGLGRKCHSVVVSV